MTLSTDQPIRLLIDCRYGRKGTIRDSVLSYGVRSTLVTYHKAEWAEEPVRKTKKDTSSKGN